MRTEKEIMTLILNIALEDVRIRAVVITGSRADINGKKDIFQDYDIIYIVDDISSFKSDHSWINIFGDRLMLQMPENNIVPPAYNNGTFAYLMLFTDGNRIDLCLMPAEQKDKLLKEIDLMRVLLDKDGIIDEIFLKSTNNCIIRHPSAKEFADCCNEFWWVCTNIAKGLWRKDLAYVKFMFEQPTRNMLILMINWYINIKAADKVTSGQFGKYFRNYLSVEEWDEFVATYPNADCENIWVSLFAMCNLFRKIALAVAAEYNYIYPVKDDENITSYLKHVRQLSPQAKEIY